MATRVNTKVVWGIIIGVILAVGAVGALWFLQARKDPTRYARAAERFKSDGDFESAWRQYRVALRYDPANLQYLASAEEVLTNYVPANSIDAAEYYNAHFIPLLNQKAQHYPDDLEAHLRMFGEIMMRAKVINTPEAWEAAEDGAMAVVNRLGGANVVRTHAEAHLWHMRLRNSLRMSRSELSEAYAETRRIAAALPEDDFAQHTAVWAGLLLAEQYVRSNQSDAATEQLKRSRTELADALAAVPDRPELTRLQLMLLAVDRQTQVRDGLEVDITEEDVLDACSQVLHLASQSGSPRIMSDAVDVVLQVGGAQAAHRAAETLQQFIESHPDQLSLTYAAARLLKQLRRMDEASELVSAIVEGTRGGVGLNAWLFDDIQRSTLALQAEIIFDSWENAADADARATALAALEQVQSRLQAQFASAATDPNRRQVDGMVAFAQQNYVDAARNLEEAIRVSRAPSDTMMLLSSAALERVNQIGLALDRIQDVATRRPGSVPVLIRLAQLQLMVRRSDEARRTIERIRVIDSEHPDLERLTQIADAQTAASEGVVDAIGRAVVNAQTAVENDDLDAARSILETAIAQAPSDTRSYEALVRLEVSYGTPEAVAEVMNRALNAMPDSARLRQLQAIVETSDPVERVEAMVRATVADPTTRSVQTIRALTAIKDQYVARLIQLTSRGDEDGMAEIQSLADRAASRIEELIASVEATAPDALELLHIKIERAIAAEDWDQAELLLSRAEQQNLDQTGGLLIRGQYELTRGRPAEAVLVFLQATDQFGFSAVAWRLLATAYEQIGNVAEAVSAYEEAYRRNPIDVSTIRPFVDLLVRVGQQERARTVMNEARRVVPQDASIREAWLRLEERAGNLARVLAVRKRVYESNPFDRVNALALATMLGRNRPTPQLILDENGNPQYSDQAWRRLPASRRQQILESVQQLWDQHWNEILTQVSGRPGDAFDPLLVRADLLRRRNRGDEATRLLTDYIDAQDNDYDRLQLLLRLGRYQISIADYNIAAETLTRAKELQDETIREADRALADLYIARGAPSGAATLLRPLWESNHDPDTGLKLFEAELARGDHDAADALLEQLSSQPNADQAMLMSRRARVLGLRVVDAFESDDAATGQSLLAQYRDLLNQYAADAPNDAQPLVMLAQSQYGEYRRTLESPDDSLLEDAMLTLQRAERINAGMPEINSLRAAILLERNDRRGAAAELRRALTLAPNSEVLRAQYIELLAGFDPQAAIAEATIAMNRDPGRPRWQEMLGDLQASALDSTSAIAAYEEALAMRPTPVLLAKWAQAQLNLQPPAYDVVLNRIDASSLDLNANPGLRCIRAMALNGLGRIDDSRTELRTAFGAFETLRLAGDETVRTDAWFAALNEIYGADRAAELESFVIETAGRELTSHELRLLAQIWFVTGDAGYSRSIELQTRSIELTGDASDDLRLTMLGELGTYYLMAKQYPESLAAFEGMLEIDPDQPQALNNAAYVLSEFLDERDPERAVRYAEHANRVTPGDPNMLDTLGWAYYKAGRLADARRELLESTKTLRTASAYYHLARVLVDLGETDRARSWLEQASDLSPDNALQAKIEALTVEIHSRGAANGAE